MVEEQLKRKETDIESLLEESDIGRRKMENLERHGEGLAEYLEEKGDEVRRKNSRGAVLSNVKVEVSELAETLNISCQKAGAIMTGLEQNLSAVREASNSVYLVKFNEISELSETLHKLPNKETRYDEKKLIEEYLSEEKPLTASEIKRHFEEDLGYEITINQVNRRLKTMRGVENTGSGYTI